ncbi:bifunctional metallophosphatase/5'-nucleotidase [Gracilibacillus timonensis]|uniref:bifunctional metallophosphatase/5'-nucleotidase n=1 Tax=Gracilibacillus timonensis TaxID=1816696 RepID=UPI000824D4DF|nr:bifunctional UDP-sugar hydrolase/5'-nucleotidase [Gracilibacillus timonensis]
MIERFHFYYCNDLHSHFDQWPNIVHYFKKEKEKNAQRGQQSWIVDIGDHIDRSHPIAEAFRGKANIRLLNEAGFDFATLGNNEGITLEHEDLFHLYDQAAFQVACANLDTLQGPNPSWLKDSITFETKYQLRVTIFGLTAPFTAFYQPLGWQVTSPYDYLAEHIQALKKDCDVLIFLSHLGLSDDEMIAEKYPEIDVIIGGHTHHLLKNGKEVNQSLLTAAGKFGKYVGEVHLEWDHTVGQLTKKQAYTVETEYLDRDQATVNLVQSMEQQAMELLQQPVTELAQPLRVDWFANTPIIQELTDKLREWTDADIAMLNAGILLDGLPEGVVTYGDIHQICPHPINPCTVPLRGIEVLEVIRGACQSSLRHLELTGFGFRGKIIGEFVFSGVKVTLQSDQDGSTRVQDVEWQGRPLKLNRIYTFATADMFTFGNMFPEIVRSTRKEFFLPEFMRDLLAQMLKQ